MLRRDLPTDDNRWSSYAISVFNKYRDEYKQTVALAEKLYGDCAFITNSSNRNDLEYLYAKMREQGTKNGQLLVEHKTDKYNRVSISRMCSFCTAFYIPADLEWISIYLNDQLVGYFRGDGYELELEDILEQARTIPHNEGYDDYLEYILSISRQGKLGFTHCQEQELQIDGDIYKRIIFIQPMLILDALYFTTIQLRTSKPCKLYLEMTLTDNKIKNNHYISWIEDSELDIPIMRYMGGCVVMESKPALCLATQLPLFPELGI